MIYTVTLNPTIDRTIHFPQVVVGALNRATRSVTDLSGKGVNVSVALSRFGLESVLTGFVAGVYGRVLVEGLRAQGYTCAFLELAEGETRSNITVIDAGSGVTTKLNEPGPTVGEEDIARLAAWLVEQCQSAPVEEGAMPHVVIFSGSAPPGAPPDAYARLIEAVQGCGAVAVLDSSGSALQAGCAARPAWLKPNEVEAMELTGCTPEDLRAPEALPEITAAIRRLGPGRVLLSLGERGAVYDDGDMVWLAEPPPITELSAVAAGDAALAGALWAWLSGPALVGAHIVRWAVATGAATAAHDGSGIPSRGRIDALYTNVTTRPLGAAR